MWLWNDVNVLSFVVFAENTRLIRETGVVGGQGRGRFAPVADGVCSHFGSLTWCGRGVCRTGILEFWADGMGLDDGEFTDDNDYLCPVKTLKAALDFGCPAPVAVLAFSAYEGTRLLQGPDGCSFPLKATWGGHHWGQELEKLRQDRPLQPS